MVFHYRETNHNWFYPDISTEEKERIVKFAKIRAANELANTLMSHAKVKFNCVSHCIQIDIDTEKLVSDE